MTDKAYPVWDLPVRVFHWGLVIAIAGAWYSAEEQWFQVHQWLGYGILVAVVFRLAWGFFGSRHARFVDFVRGPATIFAYLRGASVDTPGHNPLGALSVLAFLSLVLAQALSGLFNTDDILYSGPLYYWASEDVRGVMGEIHEWAFDALVVFVAMHILAVCFYQWRGEPLLRTMLLGHAPGKQGGSAPAPLWRAVLIVLILAALLWWVIASAPQPQPFW